MHYWNYFGTSCRTFLNSITLEVLMPVIIQPIFVLFVTFVIPDNIFLISVAICISLITSIYLAKHDLRSHLLYYWVVLSITYTVIAFELIIVPLSEIEPKENFFLILFTVISIFFLYLTATSNNKVLGSSDGGESINGELLVNGNGYVSICPVCRVKMYPRNYHCHICQECITKYDHHSYWLNCCIGEINLHYFVAGSFFGIFALAYASLLILTTICSPEFKYGILLPEDCSDVGENIEMCTCLVCGIYCLELAVILLFKVIHHSFLISKGLTSFEWKEQYRHSFCTISPYSYGFKRNWITMGCISSKKEVEDIYPNIFQVMNVDEHGNHINSGQLEITDADLVLYQRGKSPIKWPLRTLRRYGFDAEHFSFESGRRCQTGPGIYAFRCRRAEQLFNLLQSRIQTRNNGDSEITDTNANSGNSAPNRDSMYLEPAPVRRSNPGIRFSSQNGGITRLSSVGSASGSVGPLSPQSITSAPLLLDTVPLIPPLPLNRPLSQNLYANEEVIAAVAQDLEETNNNKTFDDPLSPSLEHAYLNSTSFDISPKEDPNNIVNGNHSAPEDVSSPVFDNNHLYMNIIPGTDKVAPHFLNVQTQSSSNFVNLKWEKPEDSLPNYANFETDLNLVQKTPSVTMPAAQTKSLNYIVLDLEPSGDLPKSPTFSLPPDIPKKPMGGYAAIDFKKTVALSHSVNPDFDTDSESSRKTRHSSNVNNILSHERHSSSVSD